MFKKLSKMQSSMRHILIKVNDFSNFKNEIDSLRIDDRNALHQCIKNKYIENLDDYSDADGNYQFLQHGNVHINQDGLKFMRDISLFFRIRSEIYDILKGTLGFIIGIATTLATEAVVWILKHPQETLEFLRETLHK